MGIRGSLDHVVRSPYLQDDPPFNWFLVKSQVFMTQLLPNLDLAVSSPSQRLSILSWRFSDSVLFPWTFVMAMLMPLNLRTCQYVMSVCHTTFICDYAPLGRIYSGELD